MPGLPTSQADGQVAPDGRTTPRGRILVVDDEPLKRISLQIELSEQGFEVFDASDAREACRIVDLHNVDAVVSDVRMPGMNGLDLLAYVARVRPSACVILMTAYATVENAVQAIKRGAYDYVTKPFTTQELLDKLERFFALRQIEQPGDRVETFGQLITQNHAFRQLLAQLRTAAASEQTLLLCGEYGAGKKLIAEAIHAASGRSTCPLHNVCCIGTPAADLEAELFGAERGAGAGGPRPRPGAIELAGDGTLLLDHVEDLPLETQARLVRYAERGEYERVGGYEPQRWRARLICTARRDLLEEVREGRFREDLYYRWSALSFQLPPLRDRPDDVPLLAAHFLRKHAALAEERVRRLSPHAIDELVRYSWPGNVRELENVMERALAICDGEEIRPQHVLPLAAESVGPAAPMLELLNTGTLGLNETLADIERRMILIALRQCSGNQARAAQRLGIPRTTLRDKMAKYDISGA